MKLGWVESWDDQSRTFLITFGNEPPRPLAADVTEDTPFVLATPETRMRREVKVRAGQQRFNFQVFKRYGPKCVMCGLAVKGLLDAAHIRPKLADGSDDPRNGLVLCANHHRAFDAGLFAIDPTLEIQYLPDGPDRAALGITLKSIAHLSQPPTSTLSLGCGMSGVRHRLHIVESAVTFDQLKTFIQEQMRMSHIYQPVMLMTLLERGGKASVRGIAANILSHDESQLEYYEKITKEMVGRVLRNRQVVQKEGQMFELIDFDGLTHEQVAELTRLCQEKLDEFKQNRGSAIWQHRKLSDGYISGTIRYEILKRAKFRCELCGISAEIKALEVDHIIPRNKAGSDDPSNLQSLCYSCNSMKRDRDDTDFRKVAESYQDREAGCIFCEMPKESVVLQNELCLAVEDKFPVTPGHMLVIPKRHIAEYFDLGQPELNCVRKLLGDLRQRLRASDDSVMGFNVGINCGQAAGQTVFHCHVHLIPRRLGDAERPEGGVRHVISGKGNYLDQ